MKAILTLLSILLASSISFASDTSISCSSQGILPGGCTDVPKTVAKNHVIFDIPKIHCKKCKTNIDDLIAKASTEHNFAKGFTHEVSVEEDKVTLMFDNSMSKKDTDFITSELRKALNKKGYKVIN